MKPTPRRNAAARYPCIFRGAFIREQVDPRVKELWERTTGSKAPFGRLRMNFQRQHCATINPYGSEDCPYREEECAMAFLSTVQNVLLPWITDPAAYFVKVAKSTGIERADNKPLARERHREEGSSDRRRADAGHAPGHPRDAGGESADEARLHSARRRPESIGTLLGSLDLGARQGPAQDGSQSAK